MAKKRRKRPVKAATRHAKAKALGIALLGGYDAVLARQGGGCAICGAKPKTRRLNIDHSHAHSDKGGGVRGLLCHRCNRGLAFYKDDPAMLTRAAVYLRRANERFSEEWGYE